MEEIPVRISMKIEGADKIARRLRVISQDVAHKHLKESSVASAELIRAQVANLAPRGQGNREVKGKAIGHLADNIVAQVTTEKGGQVTVSIGPSQHHFYGRFVEFGHRQVRVVGRYQKKPGGRRYRMIKELGSVPPQPFLRPGFDDSTGVAEKKFAEEIRRRLKLE